LTTDYDIPPGRKPQSRVLYRDLTDTRRRWLKSLPARRRAGVTASDCERLGWTVRMPSGHDVLTPLGRAVLRYGRADVGEVPVIPVVRTWAPR
jgi:hypothetical protein